jgi:hypothetical protein
MKAEDSTSFTLHKVCLMKLRKSRWVLFAVPRPCIASHDMKVYPVKLPRVTQPGVLPLKRNILVVTSTADVSSALVTKLERQSYFALKNRPAA